MAILSYYLERDVRTMHAVGNLRDFNRLLRSCASRTAQTLNISNMARDIGIASNTARQLLSVLEASHIIHLREPYYESLAKRLAKSPKLYFYDTGHALFLAGYSSREAMLKAPLDGRKSPMYPTPGA